MLVAETEGFEAYSFSTPFPVLSPSTSSGSKHEKALQISHGRHTDVVLVSAKLPLRFRLCGDGGI